MVETETVNFGIVPLTPRRENLQFQLKELDRGLSLLIGNPSYVEPRWILLEINFKGETLIHKDIAKRFGLTLI